MRRYWIGVAAKDHVAIGMRDGFCMFAHGKHSAAKRLSAGDRFAYYAPMTGMGEGDVVRAFVAIGEVLEGVAADRARASIRALGDLVPKTAIVEENGATRQIDASALAVGQTVLVRPRDRIPADGEIVDPREYYFRTHIRLSAADPSLAWMNNVLAVATGERRRTSVRIAVFELT